MAPGARKLALAIHVGISVGWLGAVAAYMALDFTVASGQDPEVLRGAYLGMDLIARKAIVPLALGSLISGIAMSLGTKWGLFRHYWVVMSLVLTTVATGVLLVETQVITGLATVAASAGTSHEELRALGNTLAHSVGGTLILLVVFFLNMYKPKGLTPYGWRKSAR